MTTNQGSETMQAMGDRRFERLQVVIQEQIDRIIGLEGKGPFELTVYGEKNVVLHTTDVKQIHGGDWTWTRGNNLRDELTNPNQGVVRVYFESQDDGRTYEETINLDEVKGVAPNAPASEETRKPQVAGATD